MDTNLEECEQNLDTALRLAQLGKTAESEAVTAIATARILLDIAESLAKIAGIYTKNANAE